MQGKELLAGFLLIIITGTGCAVSKRASDVSGSSSDIEKTIRNVYERNITDLGFYIQKGKLTVKEGKNKINFYYSVKYARRNNYLVSVRALNGVEALRVFISNDTILINDRINKELLYGNRNDFERITGIPVEFLKICFGDIVDYSKGQIRNINFNGNELIITGIIEGIETITSVNSENFKVSNVKLINYTTGEKITVEYKKLRGYSHILPGEVYIYDSRREVQIIIKNLKYIVPWYGDIDFIPGANFKKRRI